MRTLFLLGIAISMMSITSCKKDTDAREDFVGTWDANESIIISGQTQTRSYTFTVILDPGNPDRIIMQGFGDLGAPISATVSGKTFTTETLNIDFNGLPGTAKGNGTIDKNKLTYTVEFKSNILTQTFNGTATRR
jgi:hypothetical protein